MVRWLARFVSTCVTFGVLLSFGGSAVAQKKAKNAARQDFVEKSYRSADGAELNYRWLPPQKVEAGQKYPLVVCLHGRGGGTVAPAVLAGKELRDKHPCFIMEPRVGAEGCWAETDVLGRKLGVEALPKVVAAVRLLLEKEPIDPSRVYVTGQSMGGIGSWAAAARHPDLFAAAVPVCGAWDVSQASKMTPVAIWAFHGEKDARVPVKFSRELTAAVVKAGGTAKYTEFPGVGHGSWTQAYAEPGLWDWLFAQRKSAR
jgi:predicted peptidase